ncbi:MAG: ATPase [Treponema sp.]|nr:ATPase [Treponema sp.]
MAKTTTMRLVELMVLKQDIHGVLKYLGTLGEFQFQNDLDSPDVSERPGETLNPDGEIFVRLEKIRAALDLPELTGYTNAIELPVPEDHDEALRLIESAETINAREQEALHEKKRLEDAYNEVLAFANLKVSYAELESLSFLTMRIGKVDEGSVDSLKAALGSRAIILPLGNDSTRIMVACAKNARFFLDGELKKAGFVELQIPKDFKGVPDDVLLTLGKEKAETSAALMEAEAERRNFAETHKDRIYRLLQRYSVGSQVYEVESRLESTEMVYRITGWIPAYRSREVMKTLDELTKGRTAMREFMPDEVAGVMNGSEKVPVKLKHGKIVSAFERMIFSYGSPLYGTVDPTPFVAIFFTVLFGIMFGDAGQGLVFLLAGILMHFKLLKLGGWEKFSVIFICIGVSSTVMGLLTGEFFANETLLEPFSRWVTGLFGEPRDAILPMMPQSDPDSIKRMFLFFGFTVGVGFIINSCGIIINIINQLALKRWGKALFGKTGITGAVFFWYVIVFALRVALLGHSPAAYDWIVIGLTLFLTAFGEPFGRLVDKERPVLENGLFAAVIAAVVEIVEVVSSYLSNTVSFLRVGAFALAHAVLGFIISMMSSLAPAAGAVAISIIGNVIVVVLEGMIVAIQVVRLQYYEFFSKFFSETGREFRPFMFRYKSLKNA